ncbi:MAG: stalk domain-containing protein [Candidatus Zipacnadales bacterium]
MKKVGIVTLLGGVIVCLVASVATAEWDGRYFWVIAGHDVAGTGVKQAGVTAYLSAEDWIVGTPAYKGNGGPEAIRRLPGGKAAPLGRTPTERMGKVRVALAGVEVLGAITSFSPASRLVQVRYEDKVMVMLPGARTALLNGRLIQLSNTPALRDGKPFVPMQDVAERLLGIATDAAIERISRTVGE